MYRLKRRGTAVSSLQIPNLPPVMQSLLSARGVSTAQEAYAYLHPLEQPLHDPLLFPGIQEAAEICRQVLRRNARICVYGDYDVDGVCATMILTEVLSSLGADVFPYIPTREEGYGLHIASVEEIASRGASLMITVDCGITASACVHHAQELGMQVIVTDHHRADISNLPQCTVVSAQLGAYPCPYLCGAAVAFKLACALDIPCAMEHLDIVALATVADIVPLVEENRAIVAQGLQRLNAVPRPCITALMEAAGLSGRTIDEGTIGFQIGPRLNASGRIGSAMQSFALLRAKTLAEAQPLAQLCNENNTERKRQGAQIEAEAEEMLKSYNFVKHRAIVLKGDWNPGIIGICASHLKEKYHYPVILLSRTGDTLHGSCRSIDGVDIYLALRACEEHLQAYGGHSAAAGLSLQIDNLEAFCQSLDEYLWEHVPPEAWIPVLSYDAELPIEDIDIDLCHALQQLAPFGQENPQPVFLFRFQPEQVRTIGNGAHLKLLMTSSEGANVEAVFFRHGDLADSLAQSPGSEAMGSLSINAYLGDERPQVLLSHILPESADTVFSHASRGTLQPEFLTDILYTKENPAVQCLTVEEAVALARESMQGVVFAFADSGNARAFFSLLRHSQLPFLPDVVQGSYVQDSRCFSTVAVFPEGSVPSSVRCLVAGDLDARFFRTESQNTLLYQIIGMDVQISWAATLPTVDDLRMVYVSLKKLFSRPIHLRTLSALRTAVAQEANLPEHSVLCALTVLTDMQLISIHENPVAVTFAKGQKADPTQNPIFRRITEIRERGSSL